MYSPDTLVRTVTVRTVQRQGEVGGEGRLRREKGRMERRGDRDGSVSSSGGLLGGLKTTGFTVIVRGLYLWDVYVQYLT